MSYYQLKLALIFQSHCLHILLLCVTVLGPVFVQMEVLLFCAASAFLPVLLGLCKGNQTYRTVKVSPMAHPDRESGWSCGVHLVYLPHIVSTSLWEVM